MTGFFEGFIAGVLPASKQSGVSDAAPVPPSYQDHIGEAAPVPPSYHDHVERTAPNDGTGSVYSVNSATRSRTGGNPVVTPGKPLLPSLPPRTVPSPLPPRNPLPPLPPFHPRQPSYEEHGRGSVDNARRTSRAVVVAEPGPRRSAESMRRASNVPVGPEDEPRGEKEVVKAEMRREKWAMFIAGNLISAAVVIAEISNLSVCFDEYVGDNDYQEDTEDSEEALASDASATYILTMITLVYGFWAELLSTFALSIVYRSPLDIKSVHKVPPDDLRHCGASVIVNFLPPFSWSIIYIFGGTASIFHSNNSSCDGQGGSGLETYLLVSGVFMACGGLGMLALSAVISIFSCGSPSRRTDRCCAVARKKIHSSVLTKGPYLHVFWEVQGAIWSYRAGGLGLASAIFVGLGGMLGEILSALGSLAPDIVVQGATGSLA